MLRTIVAIAALLVAAFVFQAAGQEAKTFGVHRTPEKQIFYDVRHYRVPAQNYVVPVLFPLDLIVMLVMAGALAFAAVTWGPPAFGGSPLLYAALPLAYLVFDLLEDLWLAFLLTHRGSIGLLSSLLLQALTAGKFVTIFGSFLLVVVCGLVALFREVTA